MAAKFGTSLHSSWSENEALSMKFDDLNAEMLAEMKINFSQLLRELQIETQNIQSEIEHTEQVIKRYSVSETGGIENTEEEVQELKRFQTWLNRCRKLTGITMSFDVLGYSVKSVVEHEITREYKLHVLCMDLELHITVQLKSDLRIRETNYEIVNLKLGVPEKAVADEIVEVLEKLENSHDLVTIIRFMSSYAKERKSRREIFQKLANDPERSRYVKLPPNDVTTLVISDPDYQDVKINITWQLTANLLLCAHSVLKLWWSVSKSKMDSSDTTNLESLPSIFTEMVDVKGKEFSIFSVVDMIRNS